MALLNVLAIFGPVLYQNLLLATLLHPLKARRIQTMDDLVEAVGDEGYTLATVRGSA